MPAPEQTHVQALTSHTTEAAAQVEDEAVAVPGVVATTRAFPKQDDAPTTSKSQKPRRGGAASSSLMAFFTRGDGRSSRGSTAVGPGTPASASELAESDAREPALRPGQPMMAEAAQDGAHASASRGEMLVGNGSAGSDKPCNREAAAEWSKILCMKTRSSSSARAAAPKYLSQKEQRAFLATAGEAPLCPGHGEPAIQRLVQKEGPNRGRRFWVSMSSMLRVSVSTCEATRAAAVLCVAGQPRILVGRDD